MPRNESKSKRFVSGSVPEEQQTAKRGELPVHGGSAQRFPLQGKARGAGMAEALQSSISPAAGSSPQGGPSRFMGQPQYQAQFGEGGGLGGQPHPLAGRIALVTGASRGIGYATALALANAGAHIVAVARTVGGLEELDAAIKGLGGSATSVPLDLKDYDGIDRLGLTLHERFGRLDVLVGNAGMLGPLSPLDQVESKAWDEVIAVNVTANWRLVRATDALLKLSDAGRVVFVTSGITAYAPAKWGPYTVSKSALEALARTYAAETANTRVRVNLFTPGPVRTHMRAQAIPGEDPMTVETTPEKVAEKIVDMCLPSTQENGKVYSFPMRRFLGRGNGQAPLWADPQGGGPRGQGQFGGRWREQDPQHSNWGGGRRDYSAWAPGAPGQVRAAWRGRGGGEQGGDPGWSVRGDVPIRRSPVGSEQPAGNPPQAAAASSQPSPSSAQPRFGDGAQRFPLQGRPHHAGIAEPAPTSITPAPGSPPNWKRGPSRLMGQPRAGGPAGRLRWTTLREPGGGQGGDVPTRVGGELAARSPPQTTSAGSQPSPSGGQPRSHRRRSPQDGESDASEP